MWLKRFCPVRVAGAALAEPSGEDQPRCAACIRVYGAELSALVSGVA